jgi:hypothetical protein
MAGCALQAWAVNMKKAFGNINLVIAHSTASGYDALENRFGKPILKGDWKNSTTTKPDYDYAHENSAVFAWIDGRRFMVDHRMNYGIIRFG